MRWIPQFFHRREIYSDLSQEIRQHLDEEIEALVGGGMPRTDAERLARRNFGNVTLIEERGREVWHWRAVESLWADVNYGLRSMRKNPGFALAAIVTLALGIGINTALFSVFQQVLLRTMAVRRPGELVLLSEESRYETGTLNTYGGDSSLYFSYPAYQALRSNNHVLDDLAVSAIAPASVVSDKDAVRVQMQLISGNYFDVLGVKAVLGRLLTQADDHLHAGSPVTVLSEEYWRGHFGSDPAILNRVLLINGAPFTIVGVAAHNGLMDSSPAAVFLPVSMEQAVVAHRNDVLADPINRWLNIIGRLKPGVTRERAGVELNTLWWNWRRDVLKNTHLGIGDGKKWLETHLSANDGARGISLLADRFGRPIKILESMALLVLLIACGNVANLLLAKAARKYAELAMREALGASRRRIFQQVLVEGILLGLLGSAAGLFLGWSSLRIMLKLLPATEDLHTALSGSIDGHAIFFCIAAGFLTSLLFSIAPALLSTRIDLLRALHLQSGAVAESGGSLRNLLVVAEIALSLALIAGATVFSWNLYQLRNINPGFAISHVLSFSVDASALGRSGPQVKNEYTSIRDGILRQPGVYSVAYATNALLSGDESTSNITVAGYKDRAYEPAPERNRVSDDFFSAMQIPVLAGRVFTEQDNASSEKVAIVDEAFVKHYFAGDVQKALRSQFGFGGGNHVKTDIRIVGIIPTIRATNLQSSPGVPFIYLPYDQSYGPDSSPSHPATFYIRESSDPASSADSIRKLIHGIDPNLPIMDLATMEEHLNGVIIQPRIVAVLSLTMGTLALVLAAIGLYSLLAFVLGQRTREIGIRMALGANRSHISSLMARQVAWLVSSGMAAGALLGFAGLRVLSSFDPSLMHTPPYLFLAAALALAGVMALAAFLPARRAASVDPIKALRAE